MNGMNDNDSNPQITQDISVFFFFLTQYAIILFFPQRFENKKSILLSDESRMSFDGAIVSVLAL